MRYHYGLFGKVNEQNKEANGASANKISCKQELLHRKEEEHSISSAISLIDHRCLDLFCITINAL